MNTSPSESPARQHLPAALAPLASPGGTIAALAIDHRDALRNAYVRAGLARVTDQAMLELKERIVDALAPAASAVLIDRAALARRRPQGVGILMPLEEQGHEPLGGGRLNTLLDGFSPADAAALGAHACKLLLYYRADHPATAREQFALTARAAEECHRHGLALVVEPKAYRLAGESEDDYAQSFAEHVIAGAHDLSESGADLLKVQFPGEAPDCARLAEAAGAVPWTLLGGADVGGEEFTDQLRVAAGAGAGGFIAGRAIWGGALSLDPNAQEAWLRAHALPLMQQLVSTADSHTRKSQ
jgi:tagatose-1,6-bisphosphate aldolase